MREINFIVVKVELSKAPLFTINDGYGSGGKKANPFTPPQGARVRRQGLNVLEAEDGLGEIKEKSSNVRCF